MKTKLATLAHCSLAILAILAIAGMTDCRRDPNFIEAIPAPGTTITRDTVIKTRFDDKIYHGDPDATSNQPVQLHVDTIYTDDTECDIWVEGPSIVRGLFLPGPLQITLTWEDSQKTLAYTVARLTSRHMEVVGRWTFESHSGSSRYGAVTLILRDDENLSWTLTADGDTWTGTDWARPVDSWDNDVHLTHKDGTPWTVAIGFGNLIDDHVFRFRPE